MNAQEGLQESDDQICASPYLFCDVCGYYPIEPVHGHYVCPECHMVTKCCEGAPLEL